MNKNVTLDLNKYNVKISNDLPFTLIAGPCVIESENHSFMMAENLLNICNKLNIKLIYKSSFDKANRTSIDSYRGVGYYEGLKILEKVRKYFNIPIITDVHNVEQCKDVAKVVDILQIPAFLSRQTDLIIAASETGKMVNIKKGQFLAPWDMKNIVKKFVSTGNNNVLLCERGVSFGYNNLVVDMTSLPIMKESGYPVVFDGTHSVQRPGGLGSRTGGNRKMIPYLTRAAVSIGIAALFLEVHNDPDNAPSDGPNMVKLNELEELLILLKKFDNIIKNV